MTSIDLKMYPFLILNVYRVFQKCLNRTAKITLAACRLLLLWESCQYGGATHSAVQALMKHSVFQKHSLANKHSLIEIHWWSVCLQSNFSEIQIYNQRYIFKSVEFAVRGSSLLFHYYSDSPLVSIAYYVLHRETLFYLYLPVLEKKLECT